MNPGMLDGSLEQCGQGRGPEDHGMDYPPHRRECCHAPAAPHEPAGQQPAGPPPPYIRKGPEQGCQRPRHHQERRRDQHDQLVLDHVAGEAPVSPWVDGDQRNHQHRPSRNEPLPSSAHAAGTGQIEPQHAGEQRDGHDCMQGGKTMTAIHWAMITAAQKSPIAAAEIASKWEESLRVSPKSDANDANGANRTWVRFAPFASFASLLWPLTRTPYATTLDTSVTANVNTGTI